MEQKASYCFILQLKVWPPVGWAELYEAEGRVTLPLYYLSFLPIVKVEGIKAVMSLTHGSAEGMDGRTGSQQCM